MTKHKRSSGWVRLALNGIGLLIVLGVAVYLEIPREQEPPANNCELTERTDLGESAEAYAKVVDTGYRSVRSRRVTLITFKKGVDPDMVLTNVCEQRRYSTLLVKQLNAAGAAAIVFDKFFGPKSCNEEDVGTRNLISAVATSSAPVVVGIETDTPPSDSRGVCLIVAPSLDFGKKLDANGNPTSQPAALQGLIRLNTDVRKLPLNWFTYPNKAAVTAPEAPSNSNIEPLSWVAATVVDKGLQDESRLATLRAQGRHPFTSFINPDLFSHTDAANIVCASPAKEKQEIVSRYQMNCADHPPSTAEIRGRVVVIGDDDLQSDPHSLFDHDVPGVYLQANYIESLLDGRYFRPFAAGWNFAILASWVALLYLIFWVQPEVGLAASIAIAFLAKLVVIQLVLWKGLYPQLWIGELGFLAIALKYADSRGHRLVDAILEWREARMHHHGRKKAS